MMTECHWVEKKWIFSGTSVGLWVGISLQSAEHSHSEQLCCHSCCGEGAASQQRWEQCFLNILLWSAVLCAHLSCMQV